MLGFLKRVALWSIVGNSEILQTRILRSAPFCRVRLRFSKLRVPTLSASRSWWFQVAAVCHTQVQG